MGEQNTREKIKILLQSVGIIINNEYDCLAEENCEEGCFYILDKYLEPLLSKLDPCSDRVGESWIVYEKIPEYIIHDSSKKINKFAQILKKSLINLEAVYYYGDDETWDYINNLKLHNLYRIESSFSLEKLMENYKYYAQYNNYPATYFTEDSLVIILDTDRENEFFAEFSVMREL